MTNERHSDTPLFDKLATERDSLIAQPRTLPDSPLSQVVDLGVESDLALEALTDVRPERPLIPLEGWSIATQIFIKKINDAILDRTRRIDGESFGNYIESTIANGYIPAYEIPRFKELKNKL